MKKLAVALLAVLLPALALAAGVTLIPTVEDLYRGESVKVTITMTSDNVTGNVTSTALPRAARDAMTGKYLHYVIIDPSTLRAYGSANATDIYIRNSHNIDIMNSGFVNISGNSTEVIAQPKIGSTLVDKFLMDDNTTIEMTDGNVTSSITDIIFFLGTH